MEKNYANEVRRLMMVDRHTIKEVSKILEISEDSVLAFLAGLSEERVRTVVREEISNLLDAAGKKVGVPEYIETEKMEDALVAFVDTIATNEATAKIKDHEDYYDVH